MKRSMWRIAWVIIALGIFTVNTILTSHATDENAVYVAKVFLPQGTIVHEDSIELVRLPTVKIERDSFGEFDLTDIVGKKVLIPILPGEQIRAAKLNDQKINLALYSEVTVELKNAADAGRILKGDVVNVWVDYEDDGRKKGSLEARLKAEKILTGVVIKSVRDNRNVEIVNIEQYLPKFVTFDATDDQIKIIREKQSQGSIFFAVQKNNTERSNQVGN